MMLCVRTLILVALGVVVTLGAASAQAQQLIGTYKAWKAYTYDSSGRKICYMVTEPTKSLPKNVRRGEIYFMVTNRPADGVKDEVSLYSGYPYREGSSANVSIGKRGFKLITKDQNAWSPDAATDRQMVNFMIKGKDMTVAGTSRRGTVTKDTYSLIGFTRAHEAIKKACR